MIASRALDRQKPLMKKLDNSQKRQLIAKAHSLKPVVMLGAKGLTEAVLAEIDQALEHHELIKIKIPGSEKAERIEVAENIATQAKAEFLRLIGQVAIFYRKSKPIR